MSVQEKATVIGLGEVLWDCFKNSRKPGGAPANVAFHAQQLGNRGLVCSRVGNDSLGNELIDYLTQHGLSTELVQRDPDHPTGTVTVDTSKPDHPEYVIHENVAWDFLQFDDRTKSAMGSAAAVCFGTLAQRNPQSREAIHACLAATGPDCLRVYDVNLRQHWYAEQWITDSIRLASIIKLNEQEVTVLADLLGIPAEPVQFAREIEQRFGSRLVCVTRAERGCLLLEDGQTCEVLGLPVDVADAVGAGDAFTAGLITARLRGCSLETCARFANRVGGIVVGRHGAMPDISDKLPELISELQSREETSK